MTESIYLYSQLIDQALTMGEVVNLYLPVRRISNRVPCPFHQGTHPNLSFSEHTWFCFTCGEKGNIIQFVQKLFGLSYIAAVNKLSDDFGLNIDTDRKMTMEDKYQVYARQREAKRRAQEAKEAAYKRLDTFYARQDMVYTAKEILRIFKPREGETPSEIFTFALTHIDKYKYDLINNTEW